MGRGRVDCVVSYHMTRVIVESGYVYYGECMVSRDHGAIMSGCGLFAGVCDV